MLSRIVAAALASWSVTTVACSARPPNASIAPAPEASVSASQSKQLAPPPAALPPSASSLSTATTAPSAIPAEPPTVGASEQWQFNSNSEDPATAEGVEAIPLEMVTENIRTTQATVVARVVAGKVQHNAPQASSGGYVNHVYKAKVLSVLRGDVGEEFEYSVMAERNIPLRMPGYPILISLCGSRTTSFYIDNGYDLPAAPRLVNHARVTAKLAATRKHPATACITGD